MKKYDSRVRGTTRELVDQELLFIQMNIMMLFTRLVALVSMTNLIIYKSRTVVRGASYQCSGTVRQSVA